MLAIIIPYFKINFFEKTLASLAQQTDKRFRVYIGDDASPDNPEELINLYQGKFNLTYKKFEDNLGGVSLVKQWERCIDMMQEEEWFMILGDDDVLGEYVVETFYGNLSEIEKTAHVVRCSSVLINEKDETISQEYHHPRLEKSIESYCRKLKGESRSSLSEYIFRKESYNTFGFKDYALAWTTDDRAVIDFSQDKPVFSINALVKVRMSDQNITGKKDNLQPKILARLQSTKAILQDYALQLTVEQKKILFSVYESQLYRVETVSFSDTLFLFKKSWQVFGLRYFVNQLKSVLFKKYLKKVYSATREKIRELYFFLRYNNSWVKNYRYQKKLAEIKNITSVFSPKKLRIQSVEETILDIIKNKKSISRFGDGELRLLLPEQDLYFQKKNDALISKLKEILHAELPNLIVALPQGLNGFEEFNFPVKYWWIEYMRKHGKEISKLLNFNKCYGNSYISRFYIDYESKKNASKTVELLKNIWLDQEVLIVEGEFSRLGVGNDLFNNAKSVHRILCPSKNAFSKYAEIVEITQKYGKDKLILIALGPTATALSYDLALVGFWALDVGHIDVEYMWMLNKATQRIPLKGRMVSEVRTEIDLNLPENDQIKYKTSILEIIK